MGLYDSEQGGGPDASRMDADLTPWLRREWGIDTFLTEFPYHQYAGRDFPADEVTNDYPNRTDKPAREWSDYLAQEGPFRTDLVAVRVDRRALRTRIRRVGHATPLNQPRQGKRRYRRTFLTFAGDGPMRRAYWQNEHGGPGELRSYGEDTARRAFGWLKKRRFLAPVGGGAWDAVDLPLHVYGGVHALELKRERREWDTALEQADRASVYADYRWTVMSEDTADLALANADEFRERGVGLLTVRPEDGVTVHVWAEQCTPEVDRDLLSRYMVERWDANERVLKRLNDVREWYESEGEQPDISEPDTPDILGEIGADELETESEPPTVHGYTAGSAGGNHEPEDANHKPLTAFSGGSDE